MSVTTIIGLLSGIVSAIVSFMNWLHEQQLVQSGVAQQQLDDLKGQIHDVQIAIAAREAVRADVAARPDSLPVNDPFRRD
jgi:hypothetical protein